MPDLWTVGHGTRTLEAFVAILHAHRIEVLADVRRHPSSKRNPQFAQAPLQAALGKAGLHYVHLPDLGGFRDAGYDAHMATPPWRAGFAVLEELARHARVAICCAEARPDQCHRRQIAAHAAGLGWEVRHLLGPGPPVPERPGRQARLDGTEG